MALVNTFTDSFSAVDAGKWFYAANASVSGGQLSMSVSTAYEGLYAVNSWDLTGSAFYAELVQRPNQGNGSTGVFIGCEDGDGDRLIFGVEGTDIFAQHRVGGSTTTDAFTAYSSTTHRWVRIAESGGTVTYATSSDGSSWSTFATWSHSGITITAIFPIIFTGYWGTEPSPGTAIVDNFNIPPVPPDPLRIPVQVIQAP